MYYVVGWFPGSLFSLSLRGLLQIWGRPNLALFDSHYLRNTPILALLATIQDLGASRGRGNRVVAIGLRRSYIGVKAEAEVHVTKKLRLTVFLGIGILSLVASVCLLIVAGIGVEEVDRILMPR